VPSVPVKPCTITLESLFTNTAISLCFYKKIILPLLQVNLKNDAKLIVSHQIDNLKAPKRVTHWLDQHEHEEK
jgi:hypothetical protein